MLPQRAQLAMVLLLGACALTTLSGACVDSFSVRIGGLAGKLLGDDQPEPEPKPYPYP